MSVRLGMVVHRKLKIAKFKTARMKHGARKAGKSRNAAAGKSHCWGGQVQAGFHPAPRTWQGRPAYVFSGRRSSPHGVPALAGRGTEVLGYWAWPEAQPAKAGTPCIERRRHAKHIP